MQESKDKQAKLITDRQTKVKRAHRPKNRKANEGGA